jgi:hypothetical protein
MSEDGVVNTFKELVEYAANNASDLGGLIVRVDNVEAKNNEQDLLISTLQSDLLVLKDSVDMKFETTIAELEASTDNKITNAFSWEDVL